MEQEPATVQWTWEAGRLTLVQDWQGEVGSMGGGRRGLLGSGPGRNHPAPSSARGAAAAQRSRVMPAWTRQSEGLLPGDQHHALGRRAALHPNGSSAGWRGGPAARVVDRRHAVAA